MAKISLRDYNHKIESLIDRGQNDEAVFHSLSILGVFPKSVDTYRNLGKALLESKRYPEASEIFSKLLTVVPDDFISHVGQSIIAEEDRDLDTAIWHMEQAFELQPSNLALQEELRRLIGRRDGTPPSKIRLTRGALVRMYVRGDLYQQAISEIQSALKDDPRRVDLRVLLAKMHYQSGQNAEAAEVCANILSTSPYCFEANRIMYDLLQSTDEGKIYKERLNQLDPYLEFTSSTGQSSSEISSDRVMIEEAVYSSTKVEPETIPDWAKNIGIEWKGDETKIETTVSGELNALVSDETRQPETFDMSNPFVTDQKTFEQKTEVTSEKPLFSDEEIPDWIKNAGWIKSTEPEKAPEAPIEFDSIPSAAVAQPADDLPDWLKSLQPETEKDFLLKDSAAIGDLTGGPVPENDTPEESIPTSEELKGSIENWSKESEPVEELLEPPQIPEQPSEWMNQFMDDKAQPLNDQEPSDLPDWLKNYEKEEPSEEVSQAEVPDWLSSLDTPEIGEPLDLKDILEVGEPPELKDITMEPSDGILESSGDSVAEIQEPESVSIEEPFTPIATISESLTSFDSSDFIEKTSQDLPFETPIEAEEKTTAIPSWIDEILATTVPAMTAPEAAETLLSEEISEEIAPIVTELPPELPREGILTDETSNELLDWLNELSPEEKKPEIEPVAPVDFEQEISARVNTSELTLEKLSGDSLELVTGPEPLVEDQEQELIEEIEPLDYTDRLSELITEAKDETVSPQEIESLELVPPPLPEFEGVPFSETETLTPAIAPIEPSVLSDEETYLAPSDIEQEVPEARIEEIIDEIAPEGTSTETTLESVLVDTPVEKPDLDSLIDADKFDDLISLADNRLGDNLPIKDLIEKLSSVSEAKGTSPRFWQGLGDLLGRDSDFDSALDAYQKAENLIILK